MSRSLERKSTTLLVIGVGNLYRSDDGAGITVVRRLKERGISGIEFTEHRGEGTDLIEVMKGYRSVFLVDAVQSGSSPGEIIRIEAHREPLPAQFSAGSTHSFGVAEAIEMARILGELPQRLIVFGLQGLDFSVGANLSVEIEQAIPVLVEKIYRELKLFKTEGESAL